MTVDWSREEVVAATRTRLLRPGSVWDGCSGIDVVAESDTMLLVFRWRRDPNVYAIEVGYPTVAESPMTAEPVSSAAEWAEGLSEHLAEEFGTGLVQRARRTIRDGYVLLDPDDAPDVSPAGYYIDSVPLDDDQLRYRPPLRRLFEQLRRGASAILGTPPPPADSSPTSDAGSWLADAGMDVTLPRQLVAEDRLACWLVACVDNDRGEPYVGQAAASWEGEQHSTVRLDLLQTAPGISSDVRHALARFVIVAAAEAGARRVVTAIDDPELHRLGFRHTSSGGFAVETRER